MEKERRRQLGGVSEILQGKLEGRLLRQLAGLKRGFWFGSVKNKVTR
jgi:hypothetical protein